MNIGYTGSAGSAWAAQMQRGASPPGGRMKGGQGAEGAQSMEELFARIDSDGDGQITQGEFEAFQPGESSESASTASSFNVEMSTAQFAAQMGGGPGGPGGMHGAGGPPPGPPPSLSELDSDDDGSVSAEEFGITSDGMDTRATELFSQIDSDGSGALSSEEVEAFDSMMAERRTQGPGGPPPPGMGGADPLAALDTDEDGSVSAEEFGLDDATAQMQQLFDAIDGDDDGSLSSEEVLSFQEQMMALQAQRYAEVAAGDATTDAGMVSASA